MARNLSILGGALALAVVSGCATTGFVTSQTTQVSAKVDAVVESLEETQGRVQQNEEKVALVDRRTGAAYAAANRAQLSAETADRHARQAVRKVNTLDLALRRVVYEVVLSEDAEGFAFNSVAMPTEVEARLDEIVAAMKIAPLGAYFEIEGHTDAIGTRAVNERIGLARAEAVKRYLYERHDIPLHRISIISYGEDEPIAPNTTAAGRARNRRVVVRVIV